MVQKRREYLSGLVNGYWEYQKKQFSGEAGCFERPYAPDGRPPVFTAGSAWRNLIVKPGAQKKEVDALFALVPEGEKHKWFRSMSSSQALTQSILGNMKLYGSIPLLSELDDDDQKGLRLFGHLPVTSDQFTLEYKIKGLGELRSTSLDGCVDGEYRIAIECKFSESSYSPCPRPRLKKDDPLYESEYCSGEYPSKPMRATRCPMQAKGVKYWDYAPYLFKLDKDGYYPACPLNEGHQIIRNLLAAGTAERSVTARNGHTVIFYDARNPSFQPGGKADKVYHEVKKLLKVPAMLRKSSWQKLIALMKERNALPWLTENLALKYGF